MRIRGVLSVWGRVALGVVAGCLLGSMLGVVGPSGAVSAQTASSVEIAARKLSGGQVEFGLRTGGGHLWLPNARYLTYDTVEVDRWLRSSPFAMSDGRDVRVRARKLNSGKVEFALQVDSNRQWLPSSRLFPYRTASVGQWLYSSRYTAGDTTTSLGTTTSGASTPDRIGAWILRERPGWHLIFTVSDVYEYKIVSSVAQRRPPALSVICGLGKIDIGVLWDTTIIRVDPKSVEVSFSFDQGELVHEYWRTVDFGEITRPQQLQPFLEASRRADIVTIGVWDYLNRLVAVAVFQLNGLDAALQRLPCY